MMAPGHGGVADGQTAGIDADECVHGGASRWNALAMVVRANQAHGEIAPAGVDADGCVRGWAGRWSASAMRGAGAGPTEFTSP